MATIDDVASWDNLKASWDHVSDKRRQAGFRDVGVFDPAEWIDYELFLDQHLRRLSAEIKDHSYTPDTPLFIEKARTLGTTRPISVITLDDALVLQAAVQVIAPLTKDDRWSGTFDMVPTGDIEDPFEQWYNQWPEYEEQLKSFLEEGYSHLAVTDISSYFEYVDHGLLRQRLYSIADLQSDVADFVMYLLEHWTYRPSYAPNRYSGLPQVNHDGPRFLANHFLQEHDQRIGEDCPEYVRWMDDMNLPAHSYPEAREHIQNVDQSLRNEYLSINRKKTQILAGEDQIQEHFWFDFNRFFNRFSSTLNSLDLGEANTRTRVEEILVAKFGRFTGEYGDRKGHRAKILRRFFTMFKRINSGYLLDAIPEYLRHQTGSLEAKIFEYLHHLTWRSRILEIIDAYLHSPYNIYESVEASALRTLLHHRIDDEGDRREATRLGGELFFGRNNYDALTWYSRVLGAYILTKYGGQQDLREILDHAWHTYDQIEVPHERRHLAYLSLFGDREEETVSQFRRTSRRDPHRLVQSIWQMENTLRSGDFDEVPEVLMRRLSLRQFHNPELREYFPWTRVPFLKIFVGREQYYDQLGDKVDELQDRNNDPVVDSSLNLVIQQIT